MCSRKFSCRLKLTFDTLQKREVVWKTTSKTNISILRDNFLSGLSNKHLQSYLREKLVDTPVREIAIRWDPEVEPEANISYVAVPAQSLTPAPSPTTSPDLAQVQAQLAGLMTAVQQLLDLQIQQQQARQPQRNSNKRRNDGFNSAGQAVCFRCRSTEHRVKDCHVSGNATPRS